MSDMRTTSEEQFRSFLTALHPDTPALERAAHMTDVEWRMLARSHG